MDYALAEGSDKCHHCPAGRQCVQEYAASGAHWITSGHYRFGAETLKLYECRTPGCDGGAEYGAALCDNSKYGGPLCGVCKREFYANARSGACEDCGGRRWADQAVVVMMSIIALCVFGVAACLAARWSSARGNDDTRSRNPRIVKELAGLASAVRARLRLHETRLMVAFLTLQIIYHLSQLADKGQDLTEGSLAKSFACSSLGFTDLDFFQILPLECVRKDYFYSRVKFATIAPLSLALNSAPPWLFFFL